ncbi:VOC family protein [Oricola sp.]|uniref:VOC family protein n=1 Tax=Oricola sp. TaxID=1979950 RepID=UPI003BAA79B3
MPEQPNNTAVWFEIPVTDLDAAQKFYEQVLKIEMRRDDSNGPNPMIWFSSADDMGVSGHLYPGTPSPAGAGSTIHLASPDALEEAMQRVGPAGGTVVSPVIDIPGGRFVYVTDPDGNSVGLFTPKA